jgi:hypothetical protein
MPYFRANCRYLPEITDGYPRRKGAQSTHAKPSRYRKAYLMTMRTRRETVTFKHPAHIKGIAHLLPAGTYEVVTDEEMIEGLSFPSYRRVATMIMVPGAPPHQNSMEMIAIGSVDLSNAQTIDAGTLR